MLDGNLVVLTGRDVLSLLEGREAEIIRTVRTAYEAHAKGKSSLPHSVFLRFPNERNRIIGLPAYLGDGFEVAGMKWVSSFPGNLEKGLDRASAVVVINSPETGRPEALVEGSTISARRTAASAALAAQTLHAGREAGNFGLIGCGLINFEVTRFVRTLFPNMKTLTIYDLDERRAGQFARRSGQEFGGLQVEIVSDLKALLGGCPLVCFATTAQKPYVSDLSACPPGATLLHVSLRDLTPEAILQARNVVDDADHVCRAQTSVHLAEQLAGNRNFIQCSLADILLGKAEPRASDDDIAVFSPFGLGVLDIAVTKLVCALAREQNRGSVIESFLPDSWLKDEQMAAHSRPSTS
jgi:N-[(2S)-2-amino-2-carboxyethyl]-L-glutamate dehydrogenase